MIYVYKKYDILTYLIKSSFVIKDASHSLAAHANQCRALRDLILWARPSPMAWPM
jgi:hypothetical protein